METKICSFSNNPITFALSKDNGMMINATEMAKVFNKQVNEFLSNDKTISFIDAALKNGNSRYLNIKNKEDLYVSRQKAGTYMHRVLALKFAAWLDPEFELWVYSTIERLLFGKHVEREQSMERTIALQKEMSDIKDKEVKTGEDFDRYLTIERLLNHEKAVRKSLTTESITEMKSLFDQNLEQE
jgi:hypothetical protein